MLLKKNLFYTLLVFLAITYVCLNIASELIYSVKGQNLYPLWDPATHSLYGWKMYYYLVHFKPLLFLWEIWSKGLWPFMYYLYQIPFYFLLTPIFESSLVSSLFSFFLLGILSLILFNLSFKSVSPISSSIFLFLLITCPFYLGFSSLAMTESFGSMMQLVVYVTYLKTLELKTNKSAIVFSILLTVLFFTKYNYFLLVVFPILLNEYLLYSADWKLKNQISLAVKLIKKVFTSFAGILLFTYSIFLFALFSTGGFEFYVFNQKVSVHSIGNTGYVVLYLLLIRFGIYKKKNAAQYFKLLDKDYRLKPLLHYFIIPAIIWFAIPYPNHIKEFFGLIVNRQSEGFTIFSSATYYFNVLKDQYFANTLIFIASLLIFVLAIIRYKNQNQTVKFFILAAVIQIVLVINHPYKDARFIFTALIPIWIVIAFEINFLIIKLLRSTVSLYSFSLIFILSGILLFHNLSVQKVFDKYARKFYTQSQNLSDGFKQIRNQLNVANRLAVIGSISNNISPALLEWQFGEPYGFDDYIGIVSAKEYEKLNPSTHLLIIEPLENSTNSEIIESYRQQENFISDLIKRYKLKLLVDKKIPELQITFHLYKII